MPAPSPMLVQYLVALCCLRARPDAVEVIVGDMIYDDAAEKSRDVDVTITYPDEDGGVAALAAYEVKREASPLDVAAVEAICMKLIDMPTVTNRSLVSTSGYSKAAVKKAALHGVSLFNLEKVNEQEFFHEISVQAGTLKMHGRKALLEWRSFNVQLGVEGGYSASLTGEAAVYGSTGERHLRFENLDSAVRELLLRSTEQLVAGEVGSQLLKTWDTDALWMQSHQMDVREDALYLRDDSSAQVTQVSIDGELGWRVESTDLYAMKSVQDGSLFANAIVSLGERAGSMQCLLSTPGSNSLRVEFVQLEQRHLAAIRGLKIHPRDSILMGNP